MGRQLSRPVPDDRRAAQLDAAAVGDGRRLPGAAALPPQAQLRLLRQQVTFIFFLALSLS